MNSFTTSVWLPRYHCFHANHNRSSKTRGQNCFCPTCSSLRSAHLVGVTSPQLFRHVQAAAVLYEAAVGPVRVVETEGATAVTVPGVLDGDGAGHHGDDAAAACILLPLRKSKTLEILKDADYFSFTLPAFTTRLQSL